jgi:hypothetical protein
VPPFFFAAAKIFMPPLGTQNRVSFQVILEYSGDSPWSKQNYHRTGAVYG